MVFHRVFDEVFSTWSHIAVLRALQNSALGSTGREIARASGMNHRACLRALTDLESLSIVTRRRGGRDHLFTMNGDHVLVKEGILPLLALERQFPRTLFSFLARRLGKHVSSLIVFGSVARKEETTGSDLDLCLVVRTQAKKGTAQSAVHTITADAMRLYGARLSPLLFTEKEFARKAGRKLPPVNEIVKDGLVIAGQTLKGLLSGEK